jgi:hypothetical protein
MSVYVGPSHIAQREPIANEVISSLDRPLDYPAALLKERRCLPEALYIMVGEIGANGLVATKPWDNDNFTKQGIEAHLWHKFDDTVTSGLISAYEKEETAVTYRPYTNPQYVKGRPGHAYLLTLSMEGLVPGWMTAGPGIHVPVWGQKGPRDNPLANFKANLWICLEEARAVLGLDERLGASGEWLACGLILRAKVVVQIKLELRRSEMERLERVFDDEDKEEADKAAKRERRLREAETEIAKEAHMKAKKEDTSRSRKAAERPQIPVRKSSINSLVAIRVNQSNNQQPPKLSVTTRDARISYTHANQDRAASLMKYALLMSHGKKLEAETTWLMETTPDTGLNRTPSILTYDTTDMSHTQEQTDTGNAPRRPNRERQPADLNTIPEELRSMMTPSESSRPSSRQQPRNDSRHRRREVNYYVPSRAGSDAQERNGRSAAPSPSRSMFEHQQQQSNPRERSLRTRLSRTELLKALLQDDDPVIAEYAHFSLKEPAALEEGKRRVTYDEDAVRQGVEEHRRIIARHEAHRLDSISPRTKSSHTVTPNEVQQQQPPRPSLSVYSSHDGYIDVPHASVEHPPHPHDLQQQHDREGKIPLSPQEEKIPAEPHEPDEPATHTTRAPSRSDPFLQKSKEWKEKGNELRDRLAGLGSIGRKKGKGKKDMWDMWGDAGK